MIEVSCVHRINRVAITEDGQELPVTDFFDEFGDVCECDDAAICVAGPDKDGLWLTIDFREMEVVKMQ